MYFVNPAIAQSFFFYMSSFFVRFLAFSWCAVITAQQKLQPWAWLFQSEPSRQTFKLPWSATALWIHRPAVHRVEFTLQL